MTAPVIRCLLLQHPDLSITFVSNAFVEPIFSNIERLSFVAADLKAEHKGIRGLFRLYRFLNRSTSFDAIADLHNVLRTKILRTYFLAGGMKMAAIDKGRSEKKAMTRQVGKELRPLKSTFERYADVFRTLGFSITLDIPSGIAKRNTSSDQPAHLSEGLKRIGIAPFALHAEKTYPTAQMHEVLRMLSLQPVEVILFGGKKEAAQFEIWEGEFHNVRSMAGKTSFENELGILASLQLMVSMDSANMHLASLFGVPVVSVWGGTHPYLGFYGWGQDPANAVQIDLPCRPSSVFGNKPCINDLACMKGIAPVMIFDTIMKNLELQ